MGPVEALVADEVGEALLQDPLCQWPEERELEGVLERAGVLLDKDGETIERTDRGVRVNPEEIERMSAFKDFIESLDLDDFDKRKS